MTRTPSPRTRSRRGPLAVLLVGLLGAGGLLAIAGAQGPVVAQADQTPAYSFAGLAVPDDGLAEMCYYAATREIYGAPRTYTRVQMLNRQRMDPATGVKAAGDDTPGAVAVLKFSICSEIPTPNYNYRYTANVFVTAAKLHPYKVQHTSQEWCGTSFKQLRYGPTGLTVKSFSYFPAEGDRQWRRSGTAVPDEVLPLLARAVAATGKSVTVSRLPSLFSNRQVVPDPVEAKLVRQAQRSVTVPAGTYRCYRVALTGGGDGWFDVEADAPNRIIAFSHSGVRGKLKFVERRPYWNRASKSGFYRPGEAP